MIRCGWSILNAEKALNGDGLAFNDYCRDLANAAEKFVVHHALHIRDAFGM